MVRWEPNAAGRLREAALDLYVDKGYEQTTVAEIAERAGLTARTFFRHFPDKREVLFAGSELLLGEMVAALESGAQDEWATSTLEMLRSHCPTSVIATIELLRAGAAASDLRECLAAELALGGWITARPDFVEGVRAVVIDKDRNPTWDPADLDDVHVDAIRSALTGG